MKERFDFNYDAVDEIPKEYRTFTNEQIIYVTALVANVLLNDVKGQLLNIVEGIGLADKQEKAIKRSVTNVLHDTVKDIEECMDLVVDEDEISFIEVINKEIKWCQDNPDKSPSEDFCNGFIKGLEQSKLLYKKGMK